MKNCFRILFTLLTVVVITACGQKGPLIINSPSASADEPATREVGEQDSVLNTQTEEISPTR